MHIYKFVIASLLLTNAATSQWNQVSPATSPSARKGHGMAYSLINSSTLLFGGDTLSGPFGSISDETWLYSFGAWIQLSPTNSPPATNGIELAYDINRGVYVTYGGTPGGFIGGTALDRTWEFDMATQNWTEIVPANTPGGRANYAMTYDSTRNVTVIYGGELSTLLVGDSDQTWEWDGTDWTRTATTGTPGPLERASMCFHQGLNKTVMFGGINVLTGGVSTTWLYDGSTWTAANVTGTRPAARTGCSMVYDNFRQVCIMTGGQNPTNGTPFNDTWEWDGTNWTQVTSSYTNGRLDFGMAFDVSSRQTVMFGGVNFQTFAAYGDTWEYGAKSTSFGTGCPGSNGTPTLIATDAPRLGQSFTLDTSGLNTSLNISVFVQSLTTITPLPLDAIGMPGCTGYVSPDLLTSITGAAGHACMTIAVPSNGALMGMVLNSQSLSLDPGINALSLAASNGHTGTIGN
jgi:hypothetical protein